MSSLAELSRGEGDYEEARRLLEMALEMDTFAGDDGTSRNADFRANLGNTLVRAADLDGATRR